MTRFGWATVNNRISRVPNCSKKISKMGLYGARKLLYGLKYLAMPNFCLSLVFFSNLFWLVGPFFLNQMAQHLHRNWTGIQVKITLIWNNKSCGWQSAHPEHATLQLAKLSNYSLVCAKFGTKWEDWYLSNFAILSFFFTNVSQKIDNGKNVKIIESWYLTI